MVKPSKDDVKHARLIVKLTQTEAAKIIGKTLRAWQYYESGERGMNRSLFQFFIWKTNRQSFIDIWDNYSQISKYLSQLLPLCSLPVGSTLNISDVYEDECSDVLADKLIKLEHNSSEYYLSLPTQSELIDLVHFTRILGSEALEHHNDK